MCIDKMIKEAASFKERVVQLKKDSNYYPQLLIKQYGKDTFVSTLVRIEREGVWYVVHCIESADLTEIVTIQSLLIRMMDSAYKIQYLYKVTGEHEDIDHLQVSEKERLTK